MLLEDQKTLAQQVSLFLISVACFSVLGCDRVDLASLPPVPVVSTDSFAAGVRKQLDEMFSQVGEDPGDRKLNGELGMALQAYKQFRAADQMYQRVRMLDPKNFKWAYLHGVVLEAMGDVEAASLAFERSLELKADYPIASVRLARLLAARGGVDRAQQLYKAALKESPDLSEAYFGLGQLELSEGNAAEAVKHIEKAIQISGDFGSAHYQLGLAYRQLGDAKLAARHFDLAKANHGYAADGNDPVLNELLALNRSEQPFVHRAKMLAENGRLAEAETFNRMALERNPDSVPAHANLMSMAITKGDFKAVDSHFKKAVALDPKNARLYFNLGMARIAEKRWEESKVAFEKSLSLDATDPNTFVQLAILGKRDQQDDSVVEAHLRSAVSLEPEHPLANWLLAELLTPTVPSEAAVLLEIAVQNEHPMRPLMFVALAKANAGAKDWNAAIAAIDKAVEEADASGNAALIQQVRSFQGSVRATYIKRSKGEGS
jgi:tetratricopeptide (TPR) repeat protein